MKPSERIRHLAQTLAVERMGDNALAIHYLHQATGTVLDEIDERIRALEVGAEAVTCSQARVTSYETETGTRFFIEVKNKNAPGWMLMHLERHVALELYDELRAMLVKKDLLRPDGTR